MFDRYRDAIAQIESAGSGDYSAIGPTHPRLGRALGRYQVMEANIGPWSREALGREVSPDEFVNNPQIQDAIFDHKFGGYVNQFGPEGAAQAWFAGPGGVGKMTRQDSLGTSVGQYAEKFRNALGQTVSTQGATDMQQQQKPQGILGMFDDDQIDKPSKLEIIGNALMGMSAFPTRGMQAQMKSHQDRMAEYRGNKKTAKQQNKAAAWLRNSGMGQLADAVENGVMSGREAMAMAMQQRERTKGVTMGDRLVDPYTGDVMADFSQAGGDMTTAVQTLHQRATAGGLEPGSEAYRQFMVEGGAKSGMSLEVGPDGSVRFGTGGGAMKPLTEGQSKDTTYAVRAEGALPILDKYDAELAQIGERALDADPTGIVRGRLQSPEYQMGKQAGDEFLQAILRKDTGAAITSDEQVLYGQTYLPQPGDGPDVIAQKRQARKRALGALKAGMPPSAIIAQEKALQDTGSNIDGFTDDDLFEKYGVPK